MCQQLSQHYACGHHRPICLTPCPHALDTGKRVPMKDDDTVLSRSRSRSRSTISSIAQSVKRSDTESLPDQLHPPLPRSPLLQSSLPRSQPATALLSRSNTTNQASPLSPPPGYLASNTTRWTIANPDHPASHAPTAVTAAAPISVASPSVSSSTLSDEESIIDPNWCPYHFQRHLPASNHPCIDCYFLPQWAHLSDRYVRSYAEGHPLNKREHAERLSGIERMREEWSAKQGMERDGEGDDSDREGKLNVFVHGCGDE